MSDFDQHNRMFHTQQYRNASINMHGTELDTIEISFREAVEQAARAPVEKLVSGYAGDQLVGQYWSRDNLLAVELRAGYYRPEELEQQLAEAGFSASHTGAYLAGRLDESKPTRADVSVSEERLKSRAKFLSKPPGEKLLG